MAKPGCRRGRSATVSATVAATVAATLADAPAAGPVRLSVATTANGRLTVRPEVAPDRVQANALVTRVLADPAVVAVGLSHPCLLYTSDAADEEDSVDLGGRRIIKKKKEKHTR